MIKMLSKFGVYKSAPPPPFQEEWKGEILSPWKSWNLEYMQEYLVYGLAVYIFVYANNTIEMQIY